VFKVRAFVAARTAFFGSSRFDFWRIDLVGRDELLQLLAELREQVELALLEGPNADIRKRLELILALTEGLNERDQDSD
jgi:hypothetical protein